MMEIQVSTVMKGRHRWPRAPDHRAYLRETHEHEFMFEVTIPVQQADRDIEFHDARESLEIILRTMYPGGDLGDKSCEMMGWDVLERMPEAISARVSEDTQHGAVVTRDGVGLSKNPEGFPSLVTVCGSTKFREETQRALVELEDEGLATMSVGGFSHADKPYPPAAKARYDELHQKKIRMSDSIYVVNPDGYIGESTANEILLAIELGLPVRYRYPRFAVDPVHVRDFSRRMMRKLLLNAYKGGWEHETLETCIKGIRRETDELVNALSSGATRDRCMDEAADVANFLMMVTEMLASSDLRGKQ